MRIKQLCREDVLTVDVLESLASAAGRMVAQDVGSLAVLDDGRLAGIVTERDLTRAVANAADPAGTPVRDYVTALPASAAPDEDAEDVARRMLDLGVRHLPVVEEDEVVGMLSMRDLLVLAVWQPAEPGPP